MKGARRAGSQKPESRVSKRKESRVVSHVMEGWSRQGWRSAHCIWQPVTFEKLCQQNKSQFKVSWGMNGRQRSGEGKLETLSGNLAVRKQDGESCMEKHSKRTLSGRLAGSVNRACDSWSQHYEFLDPTLGTGHREYFKKIKETHFSGRPYKKWRNHKEDANRPSASLLGIVYIGSM